jgi:phosphoglycolate phosphatase
MRSYQYVLFDLDGTITDPKIGITKSFAYALQYFGIEVEELDTLCKFIGPPLKSSFMEHYGFSEADAKVAIEKYREYFGVTGLYENTVYAGMETLLQSFKNREKVLMVATSKPTVYAGRILEHFNLLQYFSFVAGSELNGERSQKAEVIQYAIAQNKLPNLADVIMIGDREHDIKGAKQVGIASLGVLFGYGDRNELEKAGADFIAETVEDIGRLLNI